MSIPEKIGPLRRAFSLVDVADMHFYGGLMLASVGGSLLSVRWTLVAVGAALVGVALWTTRGSH